MTFEEADALLKEVLVFLKSKGGAYRQIKNVGEIQRNILTAFATGRFFYDKKSFVCWTFDGDFLICQEAAGDLKTIRRIMRREIKHGMGWQRPERNRTIFKPHKRS